MRIETQRDTLDAGFYFRTQMEGEMTLRTVVAREREYDWGDPAELAREAAGRDGLSFLRALAGGEVPAPPFARTTGSRLVEVEAGRVVFEFQPAEYHYNPIGAVHGGMFATLLDSAAGCAVHSLLPAGVGYTSLDLTVKFVHAITVESGAAGPLRCAGTVTHLGGRTALAQAELRGPDGRLYATAVSSLLILRPPAGTAGAVTE
ncbi:MAG TPA: PaaI family thioesterase [Pseudonocardia sp.]|nr:PaaI family thioesterase [Pseudonocardia sp.]